MPAPFKRLTLAEFAALVERFEFRRRINAVHMHHTWRPTHQQFRGHDSIVAMWHHHTAVNGWSDIAQHVTIDPQGFIWLGRNWNQAPASAAGHNGNASAGPFMFEMVGDFDVGRDRLEGAQLESALGVTAHLQRRFQLAPETLLFHNQMSGKTCPGSAVRRDDILARLRQAHERLATPAPRVVRARGPAPFPDQALALHQTVDEALALLNRELPQGTAEPADAEPEHRHDVAVARAAEQARDSGLTAAHLHALRPHLVNLNGGQFSDNGEFKTSREDVEAIFGQHLPQALKALPQAQKLRLLFWAHGGLVSESAGLQLAARQLPWWQQNGVYPIYFIWETGLFETLGQLLARAGERARAGTRDVWDYTTDALIENTCRALQGPRIWGGMKHSAELASRPGGGAWYVADQLREFCAQYPDRVELHAVGHSAGAIFHAHFLSTALQQHQLPAFRSLQLLAPAIRIDQFRQTLLPLLGQGVRHTTLFTMYKDLERRDHCFHVYRKSLLYLVHHALEPERNTDILGLDQCLRRDKDLCARLGLEAGEAIGEVVWSQTPITSGCSASQATTHGAFDDDPATLNSVLRRVLGKQDADVIVDYRAPAESRGLIDWLEQVDWPEEIRLWGTPAPAAEAPPVRPPRPALVAEPLAAATGRRRALCIGIDEYPGASALSGCVADARLWASTLQGLGFEPLLMLNQAARREAMLEALGGLIREAAPGDVLVFQYSGHGTQLPDLDSDEDDDQDEALCAIDFESGAFVLDDDLRQLFQQLPAGASLTCFMDCCHSGSITRLAAGGRLLPPAGAARARYLRATPAMREAHRLYRATRGARSAGGVGPETMNHVTFSACRSDQVAWESNGQGEFTLRATRVLAREAPSLSNAAFLARVRAEFGQRPRQHPTLDCAQARREWLLLRAYAAAGAVAGAGAGASKTPVLTAA